MNAYVSKLVIEKERIFTENSNRSHGYGNLDLATYEPFPKNPSISKVFREIGLADELDSGIRNTYKYTQLYSNTEPDFKKGDIFRIIVPLSEAATSTVGPSKISNSKNTTHVGTQVTTQVSTQVTHVGTQVSTQVTHVGTQVTTQVSTKIGLTVEKKDELLTFCSTPKTRKEMQEFCGIKTRELVFLILYEKFQDETVKCTEDEIPFEMPVGWAQKRMLSISIDLPYGTARKSISRTETDNEDGNADDGVLWLPDGNHKCGDSICPFQGKK